MSKMVDSPIDKCPNCGFVFWELCPICKGCCYEMVDGKSTGKPCPNCSGTGRVVKPELMKDHTDDVMGMLHGVEIKTARVE